MPNKWLRRTALGSGALIALLAIVATYVALSSQRRLDRDYGISTALKTPDPALIEEGRHLSYSRGCADCHGDDLGGKTLLDEMPFGRIVGSNLTRMPRGHERASVHERMYRALRHGVDLDSRPLMMMPSQEFASLSAREVEAISAYVGTLRPIERKSQGSQLGPLGRALLVFGKLDGFISAESIDHRAPMAAAPPPLGSLAYGRHLAQLCTGCHRKDFAGGAMSHGPASAPPAANLTPHDTGLAAWSEQDFLTAMRTGGRPDGTQIDGNVMPWRAVGRASDAELESLWRYLRSLPPIARDVRGDRRKE